MAGEIRHEWNGTVLTITSDSGTSSADLKGEKGDMGVRGAQGVRGISGLSANAEVDSETLDSFELKDNKALFMDKEDISNETQYPTVGAVASAITEAMIEKEKDIINLAKNGEYLESVDNKIDILKGDLNAYTGNEYPTARLLEEQTQMAIGIADDAASTAYVVAFDVYGEGGSIDSNYQKKWYKDTEITAEATDEGYPSTKATYDAIQSKTGWELVKVKGADGVIKDAVDTLTQNVNIISVNFEHQYKELYVLMHIATMKNEEVTEVPSGRVAVYAGKRYNNQIFEESNPTFGDNGVPFALAFHIELCGKYFRTHRYYKSNTSSTFYAATAIASSGYADIKQTYIDMLTLEFKPTERKFPIGTYYEIWGVRA